LRISFKVNRNQILSLVDFEKEDNCNFKMIKEPMDLVLKIYLLLIFVSSLSFGLNGQIPFYKPSERTMPLKFTSDGATNVLFNKSANSKAILILNSDSTFELHYLNNIGFDLTKGYYHYKNDKIYFIWDSIKTNQAVLDPSTYEKFYKIRKPNPFKISKTVFIYKRTTQLVTIEREEYGKLELFFHSSDVLKGGLLIDSLRTFVNPVYINSAKNELILRKKIGNNLVYKLDSVWGYRKISNDYANFVYRFIACDDPFRILVCDTLIIYSVFSGKHYDACLSRGLDSEIIPLTKSSLRQNFANSTCFLQRIEAEGLMLYPTEKDARRILNYYKECISQSSKNIKSNSGEN